MLTLAGCVQQRAEATGAFDRTFTVNGPVRLELTSGSGDSHVTTGPAGEVRIHGDIHAEDWPFANARRRSSEVESDPPVSQQGNLIRVGGGSSSRHVSIDYTIIVPANTEIRGISGSGDLTVDGLQGPANFISGSGNVSASQIGSDIQAVAGSGDFQFANVQGQVQATTGSGDVDLSLVKGAIRLHTGSGDVHVAQPGNDVTIQTGSGDVEIGGAIADLRLQSGSGGFTVSGNPGTSNYWDFSTSSGDVTLNVPADASFRLYAHTTSGDIDAAIPIVMEGTAGKHELRARIGDGKARVEIQTSSGGISLH